MHELDVKIALNYSKPYLDVEEELMEFNLTFVIPDDELFLYNNNLNDEGKLNNPAEYIERYIDEILEFVSSETDSETYKTIIRFTSIVEGCFIKVKEIEYDYYWKLRTKVDSIIVPILFTTIVIGTLFFTLTEYGDSQVRQATKPKLDYHGFPSEKGN